jgi:gliding motility-associated-like protein
MQIDGNMYFCTGGNTSLKVSGADSYRWSTGDKTNSVTFNKAGDYFVTGFSKRGCEKTIPVKIVESELPGVDFSVTPTTVDTRHNTVKCSIPAQNGVDYTWDMGDGNIESGAEIQHSYTVSNSLYNYNISLTATNLSGCTNTASKIVDILLFIPNVFSPNGDGVNDLFMPGIDLEIIDRNGMSLYKGNSGWDGNYHNSKMPDDTYYYVVTYKDIKGKIQTQKGYLILKR